MIVLTILLLGIVANLDNVGISISYGLRFNKIPMKYTLFISAISALFAYVALRIGAELAETLPVMFANLIGGSLLICIGIWLLYKNLLGTQHEKPNRLVAISWKEAILLGFLLAINCLSIGFGAGITGVPPFPAALSIGVFSVISIVIGVQLGQQLGRSWFGRHSDAIAGILLIIIGLYEMFI